MNNVFFYDKGYVKTGKSASIIAVFEELKDRVSGDKIKKLPSKGNTDDVVCIVTYRDVKIGIESQGDPDSRLFSSITTFIKEECSIIVCACRTKGKDFYKVFDSIREKGYAEFACPHFCVRGLSLDAYPQLNSEYASHVVRWIDNYKD